MNLPLDRTSDIPLRAQLTAALRERMERGELGAGARLPSSRDLADQLGINRTTVVQVYNDLRDAGLVECGVGRGTYVRERAVAAEGGGPAQRPDRGALDWSRCLTRSRPLPALHAPSIGGGDPPVPLSRAVGHPDLFPVEPIKRAVDRTFARLGSQLFVYPSPAGFEPLRATLKARLARHGVAVERSELVIVNGSQQGLDLVARLLLSDGGTVVTSRPSFSGAMDVFRWYRAQLVGVPMDADGLEATALENALTQARPRLLYVIPDRHNPTGLTMSEAGRTRLLEAVRRHRVPVLEDDWLAELRADGEPPPLKARDLADQVLYLGTFSKVLAPGLRMGWLLVPKPLFEPLLALKKTCDLATNLPAQAVLHELLENGFLDDHVRDLRMQLERRRRLVDAAIDAHFPKEARTLRPHSGMVLWVELPRRTDVSRIVDEARRAGVDIAPGAPFDPTGGTLSGFRLSYATADEHDLAPALERLGRVLHEAVAGLKQPLAPAFV